MFQTKNSNVNYEGVSLPQLEPDVYKGGSITAITAGTKSGKVDGEDVQIPTVDVHLQDANGNKHVSQEKQPNDTDKYGSFFEKMLHILSSFLTKEEMTKAAKTKLESFEDLQKFMSDMHKESYKEGHKVDFKLEGSVYNGNAFVRLPNFNAKYTVPFIKSSANKEINIKFTNSELKNLAVYKKATSGEVQENADLGGVQGGTVENSDPGF